MAISVILGYRDKKSDKVYLMQIEAAGAGFVVNYQFGKRGSKLRPGTKTPVPVGIAEAEKIFKSKVAEQMAKGYEILYGEKSVPAAAPVAAAPVASGALAPMLLNPVEDFEVATLLRNPNWLMEEKMDGERKSASRKGKEITGGNRNAVDVPLVPEVAAAILKLKTKSPADFILDGEAMKGGVYYPFDIPRFLGLDLRNQPIERRIAILDALLDTVPSPYIGRVRRAFTAEEKIALFEKIKSEGGEGVVFKKIGSKYVSGRPAKGGNALKFKFLASATVLVSAQNKKRSVELAVIDGSEWVTVGNVTIPPNYEVPQVGTLVEVQYMNLIRGGSLYQAVYKGEREDKNVADSYESLKFKGEAPKVAVIELPAPVEIVPEPIEVIAPAPVAIEPAPEPKPLTAAQKAWATRKANGWSGKAAKPAADKTNLSAAALKAWATRRAKQAA